MYFPCQAKPPRFSSRFRHYQISPETPEDANKPEKQAKALLKHCQSLAKDCRFLQGAAAVCCNFTSATKVLTEIGPRFVLDPIRIFGGSFSGQTLCAQSLTVYRVSESPSSVLLLRSSQFLCLFFRLYSLCLSAFVPFVISSSRFCVGTPNSDKGT